MKLALIIDKSEAYVDFQTNKTLERWDVKSDETRNVTSLSSVGVTSLFGEAPTSIYHLEDQNAVKQLNKEIEKYTPEEIERNFSAGLIVTSSVPRTSTRKLEKAFKNIGSEIYIPPGRSDDPLALKLINELNLTKEIREIILSYVGDDYNTLLPLVSSLSTIPKEKHKFVTEEDIYIRFPQPPGAVPPWLIEKPLFNGNLQETISILRRVNQNTSFLVVLATIKNKFYLAYRVSELMEESKRLSNEEIASILGVSNPRSIYFPKNHAKQYGSKVLESALMETILTEADVKGASAAPSMAEMELLMVRLNIILQGK